MARFHLTLLCFLSLVTMSTVGSSQTLFTYDTFSTPLINPALWRGSESAVSSTGTPVNTEIRRRIASSQLELVLTTNSNAVPAGATGLTTGFTGTGTNRVRIKQAGLVDGLPEITVLQARVTVKAADVDDCASNTTGSRTRAQVSGHFFNDGTAGSGTTDLTGSIIAGLNLERHSKEGDKIVAFINRCDDSVCSFSVNLKTMTFTRTWTLNTPETLTVRWDMDQARFQFTATGATTEVQTLTYGDIPLRDAGLPKRFTKDLAVLNTPANCSAVQQEASMSALFDNVRTDQPLQ